MAGDNPPPSHPQTNVSGVHINTQTPVTCGDTIIKFKYCFYPESTMHMETYTMQIGVWSYEEQNANMYTLIY